MWFCLAKKLYAITSVILFDNLQNAGAIIGKGGANINRLRNYVSTNKLSCFLMSAVS